MAQEFEPSTPVSPYSEPPKKSRTPLIIAIIVIVILCCCCVVLGGGWWAWNNGDRYLNDFIGLAVNLNLIV